MKGVCRGKRARRDSYPHGGPLRKGPSEVWGKTKKNPSLKGEARRFTSHRTRARESPDRWGEEKQRKKRQQEGCQRQRGGAI